MANPRQQFLNISEAIGTPPLADPEMEKQMTVSTYDVKPAVRVQDIVVVEGEVEKKVEEDLEFARQTIQTVVETGQEALQSAVETAIASGNPELFASASALMQQVTDSAAKLLDIQAKLRKIRLDEKKLGESPAASKTYGEPPTPTNNFFLGTTDDLLRIIQEAKNRVPVDTQ